ncbi:uncharacterized protein BJX67DRAFT_119865 [Aspergillus lucknowensis]|uniref:DUF7907 domain-containing protein n=1 Tax=Aspergillus lucknowensis TaxID=176173 RepID=A0ABR4LQV3_9EURO
MKVFGTLSLLIGAAITSPSLVARQGTNVTDTFYLKTSGSENPDHNDLYVYGYHTGAGLNDAVLTPDVETASKGYLNGTNVQFDLHTTFPWGLYPIGVTNYAAWQFVELNAGYGIEGFFVNSTGLQWSERNGFGGWLVCDWFHNAPQLFYIYRYYTPKYPASCSEVKLLTEPTA